MPNALLDKVKGLFQHKNKYRNQNYYSYMYNLSDPVWSRRDYSKFADEAYSKNVIANRCINMIAQGAASVAWLLYKIENGKKIQIIQHPLLDLLRKPNPCCAGAEFFENIYAYKMISGNAYIQAIAPIRGKVNELHALRPDRVRVVPGSTGTAVESCKKCSLIER